MTNAAAAALRPFVELVPQDQQMWPHKWYRRGADMLKLDLGAAGLNLETAEGVLDFHSTRHTFVTNLAKSGASDREIMLIARLSTSTLVSRYAHPDATSQQAVVERLSPPPVLGAERYAESYAGSLECEKHGFSRVGWVAEWFKAPVLKTGVGESPPWVRIPPHPPVVYS